MKGISYELRNAVRQAEANEAGPFLPSLSVRRYVDLEDGVVEEAHARMIRELKFGRRGKIHGYIVAPKRMCVVLLEQRVLTRQMRSADILATRETVERVSNAAVSIQLGLSELLKNNPKKSDFQLDEPSYFRDKTVIGCAPKAWKGYGANYFQRGAEGPTQNALLVAEKQLCLGALATAFEDADQPLDTRPLVGAPHIAFIMRNSPLSEDKFLNVRERLIDILPDSVKLSDPEIHLQLDMDEAPQIIQLWHREPEEGRLRLAA